jgi:hypothetical protein
MYFDTKNILKTNRNHTIKHEKIERKLILLYKKLINEQPNYFKRILL